MLMKPCKDRISFPGSATPGGGGGGGGLGVTLLDFLRRTRCTAVVDEELVG